MIGTLYFIQEGPDGAIKIGWTSNDPQRRRDNLQIGNSHDLHLIGVVPNVQKGVETEWHARFHAHRKRSEWFFPSPAVLAAVRQQFPAPPRETLKPILVTTDIAPRLIVLRDWMRDNRVRQKDMSKAIGFGQSYISGILRGHRGLSVRFAQRVEVFTEGEVRAADLLGLEVAA